ncbi:AAA family ATPase [Candidatus Dojkabacteria bacterium]|nr:AAA family ATPase [Candidatus Dojkabacteria bacterium]
MKQGRLFRKIQNDSSKKPLADLIRPTSLDGFFGQEKLAGNGGPVRKMIEDDDLFSMIFWGPPGCGKTTLAKIIAKATSSYFVELSAVSAGKADVKKVVEEAKDVFEAYDGKRTILFLDEIHRFNKAQQDFLLPYVEDGTIILIGATTENPSFEVNSALLSRTKVFVFARLTEKDLGQILERALKELKDKNSLSVKLSGKAKEVLIKYANGDTRNLLNTLEIALKQNLKDKKSLSIAKDTIEKVIQGQGLYYDKTGEEHYNLISALHKSMRSSDPHASLYWLARMLEAGEQPEYIARRMLRFAAEDIGNAEPMATVLAESVFEAVKKIGLPECKVHLAQLAMFLADAPKDNSAYIGYAKAAADAKESLNQPVPLHLRNAPTDLMKNIGYGKGYVYDHDVEGKKSGQQCLPDELKNKKYF